MYSLLIFFLLSLEYVEGEEFNDMAIVEMQTEVALDDTVGLICLPPPGLTIAVGQHMIIAG